MNCNYFINGDKVPGDSSGTTPPPSGTDGNTIDAVCSSTEQIGDWVYLAGAVGTNPLVAQAKADALPQARVFGRITEKATATTCVVRRFGECNLDVGLSTTEKYYLDPVNAGAMILTKPSPPFLQVELGWALTDKKFFVDIYNKILVRS